MRWPRVARAGLLVVGLGFAAALYLLTRERPATDELPPPPPPADRDAVQTGGPGKMMLYRDGKEVGAIEFKRSSQYADGRHRFEGGRFEDVRGFEVEADSILAQGAQKAGAVPSEIEMIGNVLLTDTGGLRVETARATYRDADGVVTMPEVVTFTRGRLSGRGVGAVYHRDSDLVQFLAEAGARVAPDEAGQGGADATAQTMMLRRAEKVLVMNGDAKIVSASETLAGDAATIHFTEDESAVRFLELRGRASVTPLNPQASRAPDMRADNISLTFHPDGRTVQHSMLTGGAVLQLAGPSGARSVRGSRIDVYLAPNGVTLTRLEAQNNVTVVLPAAADAPGREISAATLVSTGKPGAGLQIARFDGGVRFTEKRTGKADLTATSRALVLNLAGELDAIDRADFQRDVVVLDGSVKAYGDIAVYDAARQRLRLTPGTWTPRGLPRVSDDRVTIDAPSIDVDLKTSDLTATGGATTRSTGSTASKKPALFDGDEPVLGSAADVVYLREAGTATYTGKPGARAKVIQGKSVIEGLTIVVTDARGNLEAEGRVSTVFQMAAESGGAPVEYQTSARTFSYDDAARTVIYKAAADSALARMEGTDGTVLEGRTITLRLAAESRSLEGFRIDGEAWAQLPDHYEAAGESLTYTTESATYVLTGRAKVKSPDAEKKSCVLTLGEQIEFRRGGTVAQPKGRVFGESRAVPCAESIR